MKFGVACVLILALGGACSDVHDETEEVGTPTGATCPTDSTLSYENFGQAFMETYCLRCHSESRTGEARHDAPADHNFDRLEDIRSLAGHIDQTAGAGPAATNTEMPEN